MKELLNPVSITGLLFLLLIVVFISYLGLREVKLFHILIQKTKRFHPGNLLQISLTFRCNLNCSYCTQTFIEGHRPRVTETNFIGWVRFFERFPVKIKEVYVSGGEPTLHTSFVEIVSYLLKKGYFVTVFTNLTKPEVILRLPKSKKLLIAATYHHNMDQIQFIKNYKNVNKIFNIYVKENGDIKYLAFSKLHPLLSKENAGDDFYTKRCLRIRPDLRIVKNCFELISE